jgi:nucleotide-binding universal stress UspA family protein
MKGLKRILFPTDFSANADHALLHGIRLADFDEGELIVQHVVSDYFEEHPHWAALFGIHELQTEMDGYAATHLLPILGDTAENIRLTKVISKGDTDKQIADLAEKEMADLVIMGSADGVHTNSVMRLTTRPVLAISMYSDARPAPHMHKIRTILVATDFSQHSKKVVRYAFGLKRMFGAMVYLVHVIQSPKILRFGVRHAAFFNTIERMRAWATNQLINLTPDDFVDDPTVVRLVEFGTASDRIAEVAEEVRADITIVGTHDYGAVRKQLMGSTTDDLLTKITNPVLAVKL